MADRFILFQSLDNKGKKRGGWSTTLFFYCNHYVQLTFLLTFYSTNHDKVLHYRGLLSIVLWPYAKPMNLRWCREYTFLILSGTKLAKPLPLALKRTDDLWPLIGIWDDSALWLKKLYRPQLEMMVLFLYLYARRKESYRIDMHSRIRCLLLEMFPFILFIPFYHSPSDRFCARVNHTCCCCVCFLIFYSKSLTSPDKPLPLF